MADGVLGARPRRATADEIAVAEIALAHILVARRAARAVKRQRRRLVGRIVVRLAEAGQAQARQVRSLEPHADQLVGLGLRRRRRQVAERGRRRRPAVPFRVGRIAEDDVVRDLLHVGRHGDAARLVQLGGESLQRAELRGRHAANGGVLQDGQHRRVAERSSRKVRRDVGRDGGVRPSGRRRRAGGQAAGRGRHSGEAREKAARRGGGRRRCRLGDRRRAGAPRSPPRSSRSRARPRPRRARSAAEVRSPTRVNWRLPKSNCCGSRFRRPTGSLRRRSVSPQPASKKACNVIGHVDLSSSPRRRPDRLRPGPPFPVRRIFAVSV